MLQNNYVIHTYMPVMSVFKVNLNDYAHNYTVLYILNEGVQFKNQFSLL